MSQILRPFQIKAVADVRESFKRHRIVVLQSPTGSGKTTMAAEIVRLAEAASRNVMVITHRRRLVEQFCERLIEFGIDAGIQMRGHPRERESRVQVASRDTLLSRCERNEYWAFPPADLVIVDEGRHATSPEFRRMLEHYQKAFILLLDATPVMPDGTGLGPWVQGIVAAAKVTDLIRDGYLVPVKCYAPDVKLHRGKAKRGIAGDLVESWKQYAERRPTVLFCSRVQHSLDAVAAFNEAGIKAAHVDADTSDDDRDEIFSGLSDGKVNVIANVGIIKEGIDIPCLGCCQIYMDMKSRVAFLQGIGRIMRPFAGKSYGILIDHAGAVFRHGFPDEDTEWTLDGNVDANFAAALKAGLTEQALYCKRCELVYHGQLACPQCGRQPSKPPRSIFAPPPVDASSEILTEVEREQAAEWQEKNSSRDAKIATWFACLNAAKKRNGTFKMASMIYRQKYNEWPSEDFPMMPGWSDRGRKILEVYPNFGRSKAK